MQETWAQSLRWEDPLDEAMVTHSSILAWRIPMDRGAWRATVHGAAKIQTQLRDFHFHFWVNVIPKADLGYDLGTSLAIQ